MPGLLLVAVTDDAVVLRGLERLAADLGGTLRSFETLAAAAPDEAPTAAVFNAEMPEALAAAVQWKERWPQTLLAGFVSNPSRSLWERAEAAGFDLVASRGALAAQLQKKIREWSAGRAGRRVRACDLADLAGRLGLAARLGDHPAGPIAIYHIGGKAYAAADVCPHAGARLSDGPLEGQVITCPLHGSQFDVVTGERLRGPADVDIKTYRTEVEGGQVFVRLD